MYSRYAPHAVVALFVASLFGLATVRTHPTRLPVAVGTTTTSASTTTTTTQLLPPARVIVAPKGVVLPVIDREAGAYRVTTPCGATAVVAEGTPVEAADVVLDAGHGGPESGAVGPNGMTEATLNMAVVGHAKSALEAQGVHVVLTRTSEYRMTLQSRADVVQALRPKAFVSVHHNAEPDGPFPRPGTETYYQIASAASKRLAGLVYEEVIKALSAYPGPWVADTDAGAKYRPGANGDYYAMLRRTAGVPSTLAELAYISDPPEAALLARPDVQQAEGEAVARGVIRFLITNDPGSGFVTPYPRTEPAGGGGGPVGCTDPPL
jgi:N-acetylmuramoyl-L-alanine amidase